MMRLPTSAALRATVTRAGRQATTSSAMVTRAAASTHAISNPTLANIEKRWEGMPLQEQAELWMALRDRMKENWADLTLQEKKAGECTTPEAQRSIVIPADRPERTSRGPIEPQAGASASVRPNWPLPVAPVSSMRHENAPAQ